LLHDEPAQGVAGASCLGAPEAAAVPISMRYHARSRPYQSCALGQSILWGATCGAGSCAGAPACRQL